MRYLKISTKDLLIQKYSDRLKAAQKTKEKDALVTIAGEINNTPVVVAIEFNFLVQWACWRKICCAVNYASKISTIYLFSSGGAERRRDYRPFSNV